MNLLVVILNYQSTAVLFCVFPATDWAVETS